MRVFAALQLARQLPLNNLLRNRRCGEVSSSMMSNLGVIQCLTVVLLLLLVPGHCADLKFSLKAWEDHQRSRGNQNHGAILSINAKAMISKQASRAMLQFPAQQFCFFDDGECLPDVLTNLPDGDTLNFFLQTVDCSQTTSESACDSRPDCLWAGDLCRVDFTAEIQDCLDPTYLTIHRGFFDCDELTTQSKCTGIPGCLWDGFACEFDEDTVLAALNLNQVAAGNLAQQLQCQDSLSCTSPCSTAPNGICFFPGFFDYSSFVTSSTPFCNYAKQTSVCNSKVNPSSCTGACSLTPDGGCFFPIFSPAFVDITYVANPTLQAQMRTAAQQCPTITLPSACNAFRP